MKNNTYFWLTALQAAFLLCNLYLAVAHPTPINISCTAISGFCFFYSLYRFLVAG